LRAASFRRWKARLSKPLILQSSRGRCVVFSLWKSWTQNIWWFGECKNECLEHFTVEGRRENYRERLQEKTHSSVLSLLGKRLAKTSAKLVLGTAGNVLQVS
jgi:hypothetical protein